MRCTVEDFPVQKLISFILSHEYSLYLNNVNIYNKCKISTHQNLNIQDPPVTNEMFAQFEIIFTICDKSSINKSITMHICIHVCFHRENNKAEILHLNSVYMRHVLIFLFFMISLLLVSFE